MITLHTMFALGSSSPASAAEKGLNVDLTWGTTDEEQDRAIAAIQASGARWVRIEIDWHWLETPWSAWQGWEPEQVQRHFDRAIELAHDADLRILVMVQRSPMWASGSPVYESPPINPEDFATFMTKTAARYAGKVDAYELWNEPNISRFWPSGPNAAEYVRLFKAGAAAVRATDPSAQIVFGGTATSDYRFIEAAYAAEPQLGDYFDVMAVHPYTRDGASPEELRYAPDGRISSDSFAGYREVRQVMLDHGDQKPIWFTEFGWSTTTEDHEFHDGVDEQTQAEYLEQAYRLAEQDPYVEVAFWYNLRNNYWSVDADTWEDQLGLLRTDFTPKPAFEAFKDVNSTQESPPAASDIPSGTTESAQSSLAEAVMALRVIRNEVAGRPVAIAWPSP